MKTTRSRSSSRQLQVFWLPGFHGDFLMLPGELLLPDRPAQLPNRAGTVLVWRRSGITLSG
jgi:hypothetical protein